MDDILFSWDEYKNLANIRKHGVSFAEAAKVFFDPEKLELFDKEHSSLNEERWIFIGNANMKILFVVVNITDDSIRIISARQATKKEQEAYYENRY